MLWFGVLLFSSTYGVELNNEIAADGKAQEVPVKIIFEVTDAPAAADLAFLGARLSAFNDGDVGAAGRVALAMFVRNGDGAVVAGVSGYTAWGWLYVQWLWVDDSLRGQKIASQMLDAAEVEAARRGCHGAYIDTFNPQALKVYQRQGYVPFGKLDDFPRGRTRTFLAKVLPGRGQE